MATCDVCGHNAWTVEAPCPVAECPFAAPTVQHWKPNFAFGELPETDKDVYRMLHRVHCDRRDRADMREEPDHVCQGTISIRADAITLRCPLCGNVKVDL